MMHGHYAGLARFMTAVAIEAQISWSFVAIS
jgi:hypothetical protein